MLVERHGLFTPDYQNHSHDKAHVNNTYVQFQGLNEACIKYTYIQLQGLNGAHVNYTYFQSICWHETQVQFTNFMEIRSAILSKALPSLPSICWMVLNALLEYVHLSIHYILCNCILAYLCLNDAPSQLCVALWCRFQQHCMLKHEYSNLITVALKWNATDKIWDFSTAHVAIWSKCSPKVLSWVVFMRWFTGYKVRMVLPWGVYL